MRIVERYATLKRPLVALWRGEYDPPFRKAVSLVSSRDILGQQMLTNWISRPSTHLESRTALGLWYACPWTGPPVTGSQQVAKKAFRLAALQIWSFVQRPSGTNDDKMITYRSWEELTYNVCHKQTPFSSLSSLSFHYNFDGTESATRYFLKGMSTFWIGLTANSNKALSKC